MKKNNLTIDDLLRYHDKIFIKEAEKSKEITSYTFKQENAKKYYEQLLKDSNGEFDPKKTYGLDLDTFMKKLDEWYIKWPPRWAPGCDPAVFVCFLNEL